MVCPATMPTQSLSLSFHPQTDGKETSKRKPHHSKLCKGCEGASMGKGHLALTKVLYGH